MLWRFVDMLELCEQKSARQISQIICRDRSTDDSRTVRSNNRSDGIGTDANACNMRYAHVLIMTM